MAWPGSAWADAQVYDIFVPNGVLRLVKFAAIQTCDSTDPQFSARYMLYLNCTPSVSELSRQKKEASVSVPRRLRIIQSCNLRNIWRGDERATLPCLTLFLTCDVGCVVDEDDFVEEPLGRHPDHAPNRAQQRRQHLVVEQDDHGCLQGKKRVL